MHLVEIPLNSFLYRFRILLWVEEGWRCHPQRRGRPTPPASPRPVRSPRPVTASLRKYYSQWFNTEFVARDYRDCTGADFVSGQLRSRFKRMTDKEYNTLVAAITTFPTYNILMVGPAGVGKMTVMQVMYEAALRKCAEQSFERDLHDRHPGCLRRHG